MRRLIFAVIMVLILPISAFAAGMFFADKSGDEVLQSLISTKAPKFTVRTYSDDVSGVSVEYNIYLPEGYSAEKKYPAVFFVADASSVGKPVNFSLTQGYGALVWPDECIVISPAYPAAIREEGKDFVTDKFIDLTERFVKWAVQNFSIDTSRVYATGQSMGCMTFLSLAAKNPEMFTACVFVSGQWDITELRGLIVQKFIYITSAGDDKASTGQQEVIDMFSGANIPLVHYRNVNAKAPALTIPAGQTQSFITFTAGTTLPDGTEGKYSEHMTSFDFAYRIAAVREWLLAQRKDND